MKYLFCILCTLFFENLYAQCIQSTYDAAGDRISRSVCPEALVSGPKEKNDAKNIQAIDRYNSDDIIIFPNPTDGIIRIQSSEGIIYKSIMVSDILGRILVDKKDFSGSLDISHLQAGRYFVRIRQGDRYKVFAILKQ